MNELAFYIDEYESVIQCEYIENIKGYDYVYTIIKLPDKELHDLFVKYQRSNPEIIPKETDKGLKFTFCDVDVLKIDELINKSRIYIESLRDINTKLGDIQAKKVTRKNKFKRTAISISSALLLSLTGFFIHKNIDDVNIESNNTTEYMDNEIHDDIAIGSRINMVNQNQYAINSPEPSEDDNLNIVELDKISDKNDDEVSHMGKNTTTEENNMIDDYKVLRISADDWVDGDKYYIAKAYYWDAIVKYANRYGIDPNLALAVGTHESGIHNDETNSGGAIGLFQIQVQGGWSWTGKTIEAYNFETLEYESVLITEESVSDVFENIRVGCMMLQNLLAKYNYNVAQAIMAYNYGESYLSQVINRCSYETGISVEELNNLDNLEWLDYREIIANADPLYLENVCKYIPDGTMLNFKTINGDDFSVKYENANYHDQHIQK